MRAMGAHASPLAALALGSYAATTGPAHALAAAVLESVGRPPMLPPRCLIEQRESRLESRGDALGADCVLAERVEENARTRLRQSRGDGRMASSRA